MQAARASLPRSFRPSDLPLGISFGQHGLELRWLCPEDASGLIAFFRTHTQDTIHARYGYFFAQMTPERAAKLVGIDQSRDAALGVFEPLTPGTPLIAIGRYCRANDGKSAEMAFVVREDCRGRGIATVLLHALAAIARERGLLELTARVQHDNPAMLAVFRRAGATLHHEIGTGCVTVRLILAGQRVGAAAK